MKDSCRASTGALSGSAAEKSADRSGSRLLPPPRPRALRGPALSSEHAFGDGGTVADHATPAVTAVAAAPGNIIAADAASDSSSVAHGTHALSRLLTSLLSQPAAFPSSSAAQDAVVGTLSPEQVWPNGSRLAGIEHPFVEQCFERSVCTGSARLLLHDRFHGRSPFPPLNHSSVETLHRSSKRSCHAYCCSSDRLSSSACC